MEKSRYEIRLSGPNVEAGKISILDLKDLCETLVQASERALRLTFEGISTRQGLPQWLKHSVDFTVSAFQEGSTVIPLEVLPLGWTAPSKLAQPDFWKELPLPTDDAITVLARSVREVDSPGSNEDYTDRGVLESLRLFRRSLQNFESIEIRGAGTTSFQAVCINADFVRHVDKMLQQTPEARAVMLTGKLNVIEHSDLKFLLTLSSGQKIPGYFASDLVGLDEIRHMWGSDVTIRGLAYFKSSGRIAHIVAQSIRIFESGDEVFSVENVQGDFFGAPSGSENVGGAFSALWGKWPGEESLEEILAALKN